MKYKIAGAVKADVPHYELFPVAKDQREREITLSPKVSGDVSTCKIGVGTQQICRATSHPSRWTHEDVLDWASREFGDKPGVRELVQQRGCA